jgi:hypothetical protein
MTAVSNPAGRPGSVSIRQGGLTMQKTIAILVPLILASVAPQARADIIYDNLAHAPTYTAMGGFDILGSNRPFGPQSVTTSFVAGVSGNLTDVLVPIWGGAAFDFSLTNSSHTVLESWTALAAPSQFGAVPVVDIASVLHPLLTSGDTYTLTASPNNANTDDTWDSQNSLNFFPGSQVLGTPLATPEPASLTLLGTSIAAFGGYRLRRSRRKASMT